MSTYGGLTRSTYTSVNAEPITLNSLQEEYNEAERAIQAYAIQAYITGPGYDLCPDYPGPSTGLEGSEQLMAGWHIHCPTPELYARVRDELIDDKNMHWLDGTQERREYWDKYTTATWINTNGGEYLTYGSCGGTLDSDNIEATEWLRRYSDELPPYTPKVDDKVELIHDYGIYRSGLRGEVTAVTAWETDNVNTWVTFSYGDGGSFRCNSSYIELVTESPVNITNKKESEMTRFYKLQKDTPEYVAGLIVEGNAEGNYVPVTPELWATEPEAKAIEAGYTSSFFYTFVEKGDLFRRVYPIQTKDGQKYGTLQQARDAQEVATTVKK